MPHQNQTLTLSDGRNVGFAEYGDRAGKPIVFFQGTPSSRLIHPDTALSKKLGARVIVIDRPGFGLSDFQPGRTLLDWPDDVCEVVDHLQIDQFAITGLSGGGPYIAATAYKVPHRITSALIAAGMGPYDSPGAIANLSAKKRIGFKLAHHTPWLIGLMIWAFADPRRDPEGYLKQGWDTLCDSDRNILSRPEICEMITTSYREATRQGIKGFAWELRIVSGHWGFPLEDILVDMHLWYGERDATTPVEMGHYLESLIPNSHARYLPNEGHFLIFDHWDEILNLLL